jgi:hypothetical protein
MLEIDIPIPSHINNDSIPAIVEQTCAQIGLDLVTKGTLARYPGCVHWHYKKGKARGTLEITWWVEKSRLWIKVAAGRTGDWIDEAIAGFTDEIGKYNNSQSLKRKGNTT